MNTQNRIEGRGSRADMHVHSAELEPIEIYELARARGMDFVTITDQDSIAGVLQIAHLPGTFISEELIARFAGEPQPVQILCYGINPQDHEWLRANRHDLESCAEYLADRQITCALAAPCQVAGASLAGGQLRRLAQLFPIRETHHGDRLDELGFPPSRYLERGRGTVIGGSGGHAGTDIGRVYTETPPAAGPQEFLAHIRAGHADAHAAHGARAGEFMLLSRA
ncbi:MAG TPA: PHP-associated domain-containing protein [Solirubrobacteraceae bacterium]|nr:PHP-associated domain-containing protein [Solirubrobacteraceae bacterium]